MPFLPIPAPSAFQWAAWRITEPAEALAARLPAPCLTAVARTTHPERRRERLAARCCARQLLGLHGEVSIQATPEGAPVLVPAQSVHLSLAHTEGLAVAAASPHGPVGIDVEHRERPLRPETRTLFMNPDELALYATYPTAETFLQIWCGKECLYKLGTFGGVPVSFPQHLWTAAPDDLADGGLTFRAGIMHPRCQARCRVYVRAVEAWLVSCAVVVPPDDG